MAGGKKEPGLPWSEDTGQLVTKGPRRGKLCDGGREALLGCHLLDKLAQVFTQGLTAWPLALSMSVEGVGAGGFLVGGAGGAGGRWWSEALKTPAVLGPAQHPLPCW